MPIVKVEVLRGVDGKALHINKRRIAGPKVYDCSVEVHTWDVEVDALIEAIGPQAILQALRDHRDYAGLVATDPTLHERLDAIGVAREHDGVVFSLTDRIRDLITSLE